MESSELIVNTLTFVPPESATSCLMKELKVHLTVCTLQQGGYCTDIITKLRTFFYTEKYHIFVGELQGRY